MNGHRPRFSICIPCFNHEQYIGQTIESVLNQSFQDFEILVADNSSTDNSLAVIRSFRDPRIRVIENKYNIGFAPNLQRVTENACGEFINLLSSDDVMEPNALATYDTAIRSVALDGKPIALMSDSWQIDGEDHVSAYIARSGDSLTPVRTLIPSQAELESRPPFDLMDGKDVYEKCMIELNTAGVFCSFVYSRELWTSIEGYNSTQIINPDMHFAIKLLRQFPQVIYVNRPLYRYRRHNMGQGAQQARQGALKQQVDGYKYTLEFDKSWLDGLKTSCEEQQSLFVERDCLKEGFNRLAKGRWLDASRLCAFAWATYPTRVLQQPLAWLMTLMLILGPVGIGVAWVAWNLRRRRKPSTHLDGALPHSSAQAAIS